MTNYNDGKWHGWNGGECPVHPETRCDITYADGHKIRDGRLSDFTWDEPLMFRVIKEHKQAREFWCVGRFMFETKEEAESELSRIKANDQFKQFGPVYKVREVLE